TCSIYRSWHTRNLLSTLFPYTTLFRSDGCATISVMRTIVVSGSAGLIGSETVKRFAGEGAGVIGIDNDMREKFFGAEASTKKIRSEEHTSELQSRGHLVCRLLLEKKKC